MNYIKNITLLIGASFLVDSLAQTLGPVDYLSVPAQARPFAGLSATKGLFQPSRTPLMLRDSLLKTQSHIDWSKREVQIQNGFLNPRTSNEQWLWDYTYAEIADYAYDLNEFNLRNFWLGDLVGQKSKGYKNPESSGYDFALPGILGDLSKSKPKLELSGDLTFALKGSRTLRSDDEYSKRRSLFATPTPSVQSNFKIKGKIGKHFYVEMNSTEELQRDDIKLVYKESEKGEFEDQILQEIEAGRTSLELPGTALTGFAESHKGLFGVRGKFKFGDVMVTAIASQESGSQENYTLNSQSKETEFSIRDKDFIPYKYYFLSTAEKNYYIDELLRGNRNPVNKSQEIHIYTLAGDNDLSPIIGVSLNYPNGTSLNNMRIKELKPNNQQQNNKDFDYDYRGGVVYLPKSNKDQIFAWSYDPIRPGDKSNLFIFKDNKEVDPELNSLMLRNRYSVGITEETKNQFTLRMVDDRNNPVAKLTALAIADKSNVPKRQDNSIFDTKRGEMILPCQALTQAGRKAYTNNGDTVTIPNGMTFDEFQRKACLEPFRLLDDSLSTLSRIYNVSVRELNISPTRFAFLGKAKKRNTTLKVSENQSVSSGGCFDISPGTEKLMIGSTQLTRGVDYEVMYEYGQIELISERAKDPNSEISVTYECEPMFSIDNKLLMGLRAEYPFWRLGEGSHLGATALYKSQSTSEAQPRVGHEPFQSLLFGANIKLTDQNRFLTKMVNYIPFLDLKQPSQWRFEAEVARSYHNPNTKGSALLDDFENSKKEIPYSLRRQSWTPASAPGGVTGDGLWFNQKYDYRHQGQVIWNSNFTRRFADIFGSSGDDRIDVSEIPVMQLDFEGNDELKLGNSWGGLMKSNSDYARDLSQFRYVEVVLQGDVGLFHLDFGAISEDLSINGEAPDGTLQTEGDFRTGRASNDYGLDGVASGSGEVNLKWRCRSEEDCISQKMTESSARDAAQDDFQLEDQVSHPSRAINGTEGNNADKGGGWDTEDLNRNGSLDVQNDFVRYTIDLSKSVGFDRLRGGWKRYRIPLAEFDTLWSPSRGDLKKILQNNAMTRFWLSDLPSGVGGAQLQIARLSVVGSQWENADRSTAYDAVTSSDQQFVENLGAVDLSQKGSKDSNYLQVRVINNRDDIGKYFVSPNTTVEKEKDSNTPLKEQSLVLQYGNLHPKQEVTATRSFDTESKDLTQYSDLQLEIHLDGLPSGIRENTRFAIQLGQGDQSGSKNYYEWSFRPHSARCEEMRLNLQSSVSDADLRAKLNECHATNWLSNVFKIPLKDLWPLLKYEARAGEQDSLWKLKSTLTGTYDQSFSSRSALYFELNKRKADMKTLEDELMTANLARRQEILEQLNRLEVIGVVGQPTLSRINWIRFVVRGDDDADLPIQGTIWINDLKLSGARSAWGTAMRSAAQVDLSDFATLSGDVSYRDGDFATLSSNGSSPLPSLSQAKTAVLARSDLKVSIDKFLKDTWKVKLPITLSQSTQLERPYLQPGSDIGLTHDDLGTLLPELSERPTRWTTDYSQEASDRDFRKSIPLSRGFQSLSEQKSLGLSYKKEAGVDVPFWLEIPRSFMLERPSLNFRYESKESRGALSIDTSKSYNTTIQYDLSRKSPAIKGLLRLWPEQFDLTFADFSYTRTWHKDRTLELRSDTITRVQDWQLNLTHKANVQWALLPFLNLNYTLDLQRLLDDDWQAWGEGDWMGTEQGGFLGKNIIFDYDRSDYQLLMQKKDTTQKIYQDRILSAQVSELGQDYLILYKERKRAQNFRINFTPSIPFVDFITHKVNYTADFTQSKSQPEDFNPIDLTMARQNYWTVDRLASFEYRPTLLLQKFSQLFGKDNKVFKGLKYIQMNGINASWTANVNTKSENFTLPFLKDSAHVSPAQYYLWAFGFGNGETFRNGWDIVTGDMTLKGPKDHTRWAQYFSPYHHNLDSLVDQNQFSNSIERSSSVDTRMTLPFAWDLSENGSVAWKINIQQNRMYPLQIDTTITWPKWSVGSRLPNIVPKFAVLKGALNSLSFNDKFIFEKQTILKAFQSNEDKSSRKWSWEPLLGIQAETKNKITINNDLNYSIERGWKFLNKYSLDSNAKSIELWDIYNEAVTFWTWRDKDLQRNTKLSNKTTVSYALPINKGFRFFRWYLKLSNPINLSASFGYETQYATIYNYKENKALGFDSERTILIKNNPSDPKHPYIVELDLAENPVTTDLTTYTFRTGADYKFTDKITSDASVDYRRDVDAVTGGKEKGDIITSTLTYLFRVKIVF